MRVNTSLVDHRGRKYLATDVRNRFLAAVRAHPQPTVQTLARTLAMTGCRVQESDKRGFVGVVVEAAPGRMENVLGGDVRVIVDAPVLTWVLAVMGRQ